MPVHAIRVNTVIEYRQWILLYLAERLQSVPSTKLRMCSLTLWLIAVKLFI